MKLPNALREAHQNSSLSQKQIANALNVGQPAIANKFKRENPNVNSVIDLIDLMGYELVIQPKKQGRRPDGQIVITKED